MKIYNVMHYEDCVGTFYQCSFSTHEKAQEFIDNIDLKYLYGEEGRENFTIKEHIVDNGWQNE